MGKRYLAHVLEIMGKQVCPCHPTGQYERNGALVTLVLLIVDQTACRLNNSTIREESWQSSNHYKVLAPLKDTPPPIEYIRDRVARRL